MRRFRSYTFEICYYFWTALLALATLPLAAFLNPAGMRRVARIWMTGIAWLARVLVGIHYRVEGLHNLPSEPVLIAAKHQSAWETLTFHRLVPKIAIALKAELTRVPVVGWYLMIGGNLRLDRQGGAKALRMLLKDARSALDRQCSILIFPEGTRRALGAEPDYKSGVAALYRGLGIPVVPVALNSGVFWPRGHGNKRPGMITVRFLTPIPPGLERPVFLATLQARTEEATAELVEEARRQGLPATARGSSSPADGPVY